MANILAMSETLTPSAADAALDFTALAASVPGLLGDIRSDHAGETGAVMIYRGILAVSRDAGIRAFAAQHMAAEQGHLDLLNQILAPSQCSRLLPIWRIAGFFTGFLPGLVGPRAVYATVAAVETFVDRHYQAQIVKLPPAGRGAALRALLVACQADEVHHRDEASAHLAVPPGPWLRLWAFIVGRGSEAAVVAARRL